jgi:hypothetical protein
MGPPSIGDVDGDGVGDLAIPDGAAVQVHLGPLSGPRDVTLDADLSFAADPGSFTRAVVADANGDGRDELLVGASAAADVVPSGDLLGNGAVDAYDAAVPGARDAHLYGTCGAHVATDLVGASPAILGTSVAVVGDVTGDGLADVGVAGWGALGRGAVWIVADVLGASGDASLTDAAAAVVLGADAGDDLGAVGRLGDLDGDGVDELVVGSAVAGTAYVLLGPVAGTLDAADADLALVGGAFDGELGTVIEGGDLTGDGVPELILGGWGASYAPGSGVAYVLDGVDLLGAIP